MTAIGVVLIAIICPVFAGQAADSCDDIEIRAQSCPIAAAWLAGWMPAGFRVVSVDCKEERIAAR